MQLKHYEDRAGFLSRAQDSCNTWPPGHCPSALEEARQSWNLSQQLAIARIDAAAAEGDVETSALILDGMNKSGVDMQIFHVTSAIRACWAAKGQRWRAAEFLFQMAAGLGLQPTLPTFACLAGAYRSAPLQKVVEVYEMMQESGLTPNEVFAES